MKLTRVVAIFFVVLFISKDGSALSEYHSRIVNGQKANPAEFPFQIALQWNGAQQCGGSILNENYALTAAHCLPVIKPEQLRVIAGAVNLDDVEETGSYHNVTKILIHEKYEERNSWNNDVALLRIDPPFVFSKYISPVRLPKHNEIIKEQQMVVISGFGRVRMGGYFSSRLLKTYVHVVGNDYCQKRYDIDNQIIRSTNICVHNPYKDTGFCNGDSGGPLSWNGTIHGVVSFSLYGGCSEGSTRYPQVFARVTSFLGWISDTVRKDGGVL